MCTLNNTTISAEGWQQGVQLLPYLAAALLLPPQVQRRPQQDLPDCGARLRPAGQLSAAVTSTGSQVRPLPEDQCGHQGVPQVYLHYPVAMASYASGWWQRWQAW